MSWGGKRQGSGRKSKADEVKLIEKLSPLEDLALQKLHEGLESGDYKFVSLFYQYFYGKPRETQDITLSQDKPLFEVIVKDNDKTSSN